MENNEIEIKGFFAGFELNDDNDKYIRITFSFYNDETEKIFKKKMTLGTIYTIKITESE